MSNSIKETLTKAINYMNDLSTTSSPQMPVRQRQEVWKLKPNNQSAQVTGNHTTSQTARETVVLYKPITPAEQEEVVSQERLQEAIIWSEVLGKPLSKRRKRRL